MNEQQEEKEEKEKGEEKKGEVKKEEETQQTHNNTINRGQTTLWHVTVTDARRVTDYKHITEKNHTNRKQTNSIHRQQFSPDFQNKRHIAATAEVTATVQRTARQKD